jgi:predicted ester cyclase
MSKLSTSLVVALGLLAFTGCKKKKEEGTVQKPVEGSAAMQPPPPPQPEPEKPMAGADLAAKYQKCIALLSDNKIDDVRKDCIDDNFKSHDMGTGEERTGGDAFVGYAKAMKTAFPDWKLTPQVVLVNGRNILAIELVTGTQSGELAMPGMPPVPATNKKIGLFMFHRLTTSDANKATEEWAFMDPATMMGQLGLAPKGAPPTRPAVDKGIDGAPIVAVTADDDKEKKNLEAYKKGMDAFNAHKLPDLMAGFTDDALESDQAMDKDHKGKKEVEANMKALITGFSDGKVTATDTFAAGDWVVVIGKFEGTHDHDFMKIKKTGKKVSLDYAEVAMMKDAKTSQVWRFHSGMQFMTQLGLMPAPGAAPAGAGSAAAPAAGSAAAAPAGEKKAEKAEKAEKAPEKK